MNKKLVIFGGGVSTPIADHLSLSANAYGGTARKLQEKFANHIDCKMDVVLLQSRMASPDQWHFETIEDLKNVQKNIINDKNTKVVVFNCALPNFQYENGSTNVRFKTSSNLILTLTPAEKLIRNFRKERKDIFLVGFKTTLNASEKEMYEEGCKLLKESSANLILVNDRKNLMNMIVTPEESTYSYTANRNDALNELVGMTLSRSHLTFTKSKVVSDIGIPWEDPRIPSNLREVVDFCITQNAYKEGYPGSGVTVGHFAAKLDATTFITSKRKSNFNNLKQTGMVLIETDEEDTVYAYGGKPSVGGQSQRIVFTDHEDVDCIVHFHCPLRKDATDSIPVASQKELECGSHECGKNTSSHLKSFNVNGDSIKAVYLDKHGPNIVFSKDTKSENVIKFINNNFDLTSKTNGFSYD